MKTFTWICPECGAENEVEMHTDLNAHFVSVICEECDYELEGCPCGEAEGINNDEE